MSGLLLNNNNDNSNNNNSDDTVTIIIFDINVFNLFGMLQYKVMIVD